MLERDYLADLSKAVAAYLNTVQAVGECLAVSCPEVGRPYRDRISRLRARVAFEATPDTITASAEAVQAELAGYSAATSGFLEGQNRELRRGIAVLEEAAETLAKRVEFYGSSLRDLAARIETAEYPADPVQLKFLAFAHATALRNCTEGLVHESTSLVAKSRSAIKESAIRLANAQLTDDATGTISRSEMERQIEAHSAADIGFTLLLFELQGSVDDEVMRQAAAKLGSQFRHNDLIGRWSEREFLILFRGNPATRSVARDANHSVA